MRAPGPGTPCPYCRFPVKTVGARLTCGACASAHHPECWEENGGCAVTGCAGGAASNANARAPLPPLAHSAASRETAPPGSAAAPGAGSGDSVRIALTANDATPHARRRRARSMLAIAVASGTLVFLGAAVGAVVMRLSDEPPRGLSTPAPVAPARATPSAEQLAKPAPPASETRGARDRSGNCRSLVFTRFGQRIHARGIVATRTTCGVAYEAIRARPTVRVAQGWQCPLTHDPGFTTCTRGGARLEWRPRFRGCGAFAARQTDGTLEDVTIVAHDATSCEQARAVVEAGPSRRAAAGWICPVTGDETRTSCTRGAQRVAWLIHG
jgi:hypothetical protein